MNLLGVTTVAAIDERTQYENENKREMGDCSSTVYEHKAG